MCSPDPYLEDWICTILNLIEDEPGVWTTRICRQLNGLPEARRSVAYCGRCREYANPRKQARARRHAAMPALPGLEPPFQLHDPCQRISLRKVMRCLCRLTWATMVAGRKEKIPDLNGWGRDWDFATRYYPT